jgi:hypothetical protein
LIGPSTFGACAIALWAASLTPFASRLLTRTVLWREQFLARDFPVAFPVELPKHIRSVAQLLCVDHAVVIGIQRGKQIRHVMPALTAGAMAFAWGISGRTLRWSVLGLQRPRGKRECDGGDEYLCGSHGFVVLF